MTLLLLAGTSEGREIATALHGQGVDFIASLAGATRQPAPLPGQVRTGGFGGEAAFRAFLAEHRIEGIIDATHAFAARMSERSARVARETGIAYLQVLRPQWQPQAGDRWTFIDAEHEARTHINPPARVFLATGRQTLAHFDNLADCTLISRQIDPPTNAFPFPKGEFLVGRPPFSAADEKALFARLSIDWLITKNAGGDSSATKLTAARDLGLPVIMINRPAQPDAERVTTAAQAITWARRFQ